HALFENFAFEPLSTTAGEIAMIRDLFFELYDADQDAVRTLRKQEATESSFRKYAGRYEVLHIATHGFFADPSKQSVEQLADDEGPGRSETLLDYVRGFHPGMLSGLALTGANHAPDSDDEDDGILTADEISFLRLKGVALVVLSASETGLGPSAGGEGVLGVQRAFQVSGAKSVIGTLWKVDDLATRLLMERFYRNLWDKEMTRVDALREAQLWMLNNPTSIRGTKRIETESTRTPPYYWAAFVLSGDWR
ncbi:MAG: CHAT domain-containing protein, partial [Planctomycetota bacterium]|nr:CHAT domain-containing protein [Planctomycetota bacterium]